MTALNMSSVFMSDTFCSCYSCTSWTAAEGDTCVILLVHLFVVINSLHSNDKVDSACVEFESAPYTIFRHKKCMGAFFRKSLGNMYMGEVLFKEYMSHNEKHRIKVCS